MPAILFMVEFVGCSLVLSAIAWLRYLYGALLPARDWEVRCVIPCLSALIAIILIPMTIQNRATIMQPDMRSLDMSFALGLHVVSAALVAWLLVEVGRYRTRPRNASHGNRSYSRIAPPRWRRAKIGKGKNRSR